MAETYLASWRDHHSKGKRRADVDGDKFTVKYVHYTQFIIFQNPESFPFLFCRCVGVWDTVGALGLPQEFLTLSKRTVRLFGFPDRMVGEHVEHAFQALALNEMRADFVGCFPLLS